MLQTLLVSILPSQVASGCNEKLTSVVMKILYFTSVIQAWNGSVIDSMIIIMFVRSASLEDFYYSYPSI